MQSQRLSLGMVDVQGIVTKHPTGTEDYSIRGKFKVPVNFHIGSMGLALATNVTVDSVPPTLGGKRCKDSAWRSLLHRGLSISKIVTIIHCMCSCSHPDVGSIMSVVHVVSKP